MDTDQIGEFLEHKGLSDDEIDDYFEHHGVKGMKWGTRKQARLERTQRVAEGKGSLGDKVRTLGRQSTTSLILNRGLKGSAANQVKQMEALKERTLTGKRTVKDILNTSGGTQLFSLGLPPKTAKDHAAKVSSGQHSAEGTLKFAGNLAAAVVVGSLVGKGIAAVITR